MNETKKSIEDMQIGDHICCIHKNSEEQFSILIPYFKIGLENNEKCFYVLDKNTPEIIIEEFKLRGLVLEPYIKSGQFNIVTKNDIYLNEGVFNLVRTIKLIQNIEKIALEQGYLGVRATGEMSWVLNNDSGKNQLIEYEEKLNKLFTELRFVTICQYDETKFESNVLVEVIQIHPIVIVRGEFC